VTATVVDVSAYQGTGGAPIAKLVKAGAKAIIMRASIGTQPDVAVDENAQACIAAGIPFGFYAFAYPGLAAPDQARAFWKACSKYVKPDTALVYDAERGQAAARADNFAKELRQLIGADRQLTLYTSYGYWRSKGNPDATGDYDALWLAYYTERGQNLDAKLDTSSVDFRVHGLAGFRLAAMVQFGPLRLDGHAYDGDLYGLDISTWRKVLGDGDPSPVRPPVDQRPRYRLGANKYLDALIANAKLLDVPDPGNGPAWEVGVGDAKADAIDALTQLHIADPLP
jgi:hypothetical protein